MARVKIPVSFSYTTNPAGSTPTYVSTSSGSYVSQAADLTEPVANTTVTVTVRSTGSPTTVWQTETGGATYTTLTTDASGNVPGWVNEGSYAIAAAPAGAFGGATYYFDAVRGDGVSNIAAGAVGLSALVAAVQQALVPTGAILDHGGAVAPTGFVLCDGSVYATGSTGSMYNALSGVISPHWNTGGEGGGNFRVPDLRGLVTVGSGAGTSTPTLTSRTLGPRLSGIAGGEENHGLLSTESGNPGGTTGSETVAHSHFSQSGAFGNVVSFATVATGAYAVPGGSAPPGSSALNEDALTNENAAHTHVMAAVNAAAVHNNMSPFAVATKIIKL